MCWWKKTAGIYPKGGDHIPDGASWIYFITSDIYAREEWDVAVIYLPNLFLLLNNPDLNHMVLHGKIAELIAMITSYTKHKLISYEIGYAII